MRAASAPSAAGSPDTGEKARKQLDSKQRSTWTFSPVTKKVESKKLYNRKRKAHDRYDDYGMGFSYGLI